MTRAIDLFAGFGGFSLGAQRAGVDVLWAANHWRLAVDTHAANHPGVEHACQDLRQADFHSLPDFDLLLASPACQGHSSASQPKRRRYHDSLRATAWAVVDAADAKEPEALVIENVPDFRRWRLYQPWKAALAALGYRLEEHLVVASAHGVPQRRTRLFITGTRSKAAPELRLESVGPEPAIGDFLEADAPGWRSIEKAQPGAQKRIAKGRANHGDRFITQHVTGHPGIPLGEPIRTVTTKEMFALVEGDQYRPLTLREYGRAMGFPDSYELPQVKRADVIKGLGNAVCPPVAEAVVGAVLAA